jgi:IS30 family transposase
MHLSPTQLEIRNLVGAPQTTLREVSTLNIGDEPGMQHSTPSREVLRRVERQKNYCMASRHKGIHLHDAPERQPSYHTAVLPSICASKRTLLLQ